MNDIDDKLPTGFQGPVKAWSGLVPAATDVLRLPRDLEALSSPPPEGGYGLVEIRAVTERLGRFEDAVARAAERLADGGTLLVEVENVQAMQMLHQVVEGRPGPFDPAGSLDDPTRPLPLRRALAAAVDAGLDVTDVVRVPSSHGQFGQAFAEALMDQGFLPLDWLGAPPPARFWLTCRKRSMIAGSVIVAGGGSAACQRTVDCVRAWLPEDWEVVVSEARRECTQWNRGIASARGELVWFLRGGCEPSAELFDSLRIMAGIGPIGPRHVEEEGSGELAGLMMPRIDVLFVGPVPEVITNTAVALEEYGMRLGSRLTAVRSVDHPLEVPAAEVEDPATFASEASELIRRWSPIEERRPSAAGSDAEGDEPGDLPPAPWAGRRPRVTLCMIARNEERFLGECLSRARDAVDEIVIVDTGSEDRTVEIAESFGAKVLHEPWEDDFSAPRNTAIRAATGDWILVLDADEFLVDGACGRIRELVEDAGVSGYHLRFTNIYSSGKTVGVMMVRLFRNLPGLCYENVIHEQVSPSLQRLGAERGLILSAAEVEVEHHGYADDVMDSRDKNARNERLFRKQMELFPDDVYTHYKYGDFLRRVPGRNEDAHALLSRCLELILEGPPDVAAGLPYAGEVAALCALETARMGRSEDAREILDVALRRFLPTPNLFYLAASIALAEERTGDALAYYRRCLAYHGQVLVVPIQEGVTSYVSLTGIAQCWMLRGETERARRLLEQAIAIEPEYEVAHLALSRLRLEQGDPKQALMVLTSFLAGHPDSPGACQQTSLILHRLGQTDEAKRMGHHAVRLLEARALEREAADMNRILAAM